MSLALLVYPLWLLLLLLLLLLPLLLLLLPLLPLLPLLLLLLLLLPWMVSCVWRYWPKTLNRCLDAQMIACIVFSGTHGFKSISLINL